MATRLLSEKEKRELDFAFQRRTPTDIRNYTYAQQQGLWNPPNNRQVSFNDADLQTTPERPFTMDEANDPKNWVGGKFIPPTGGAVGRSAITPYGNLSSDRQLALNPPPAGGGGASGQPPPRVNLAESWQKAMTNLLRQHQTQNGQADKDLLESRRLLRSARFGAATDPTSEELKFLTGDQQRALRNIDIKSYESQVGKVESALESRKIERNQLRQMMENAQNRLADLEKEERQYAFEREKLASQQALEREKLAEKKIDTQITEIGGRKVLVNTQTGETIRVIGTSGTGTAGTGGGAGVTGGSLSARAEAVYNNPALLSNYTPTEKGKILNEITAKGLDTNRFSIPALNAGQREQIALFDEIEAEALRAAEQYRKGVDTGPLASRVSAVGSKLGFAPEFTDLRSTIDNMGSILLRMRSGAAVTPQEFERIKGFIPQINEDETTASRKVNRFFDEIAKAKGNYVTRATQTAFQIQQSSQVGFGQGGNQSTYTSPKNRTYKLPNQ